ncbi:MAG: AMP-binding protein [Ilumatobacter sp.]|nr:AMP-binding protein [Ilumatobacter sp.]
MTLAENVAFARRLGLVDPRQIAATTTALARWGPNLAAMYTASALRHPRRPAIIDDRGALTYAELDRRATALAKGLRALGLGAGDHVGVLCTNHRGFVEASVATAKAGTPCVYLNTGFAAQQLGDVLAREGVAALICDSEFLPIVESSGFAGETIVARGDAGTHRSLADVRDLASSRPLLPSRPIAPVLLTSGTTGTPKGARRDGRPAGLASAIGILQRVPYRTGDVAVIPTPLFHAWGLAQMTIAAATGSTAVLVQRFTPAATLDAVATERATVLAVVPIMLQRLLASDLEVDTSSLRIVASSGSALPAHVALAWMDRYGDNLYNIYGSTEVGQATLADPADLRVAPGTAGRVVGGSTVEIVDGDGAPVPAGTTGRVVVGNDAQFTQYTGGGTKERVRGLMVSGDVGYFDDAGRLFVTGRADDMIVSGGENVFPQEIEELLLGHPDIADAAVFGVPDDEFGQRLAAHVVARGDLDAAGVRELVASELARHKVPRDVTFVEELPRNSTGKLLRNELGA